MEKKYYLHRISHEGYISYSLLKEGYLTLGWEKFTDTDIITAAKEEGYKDFDPIAERLGEGKNRSRWSIWYFARMNKGDIIVVPLYDKRFSVYEVDVPARPISELEEEISSITPAWGDHSIIWRDHRLFDESEGDSGRRVDLGFFIKVKPVVENVQRNYVPGTLISRMKIRATNADISDIYEDVECGITAGKTNTPITLYEDVIDKLVENLRISMAHILSPDKFELLIKWYLEKCGASSAWIPAKNETGKRDGADADIIAEFENLKYIVYVQAKFHNGKTSDWSVHQIESYKNQKGDGDPDYTYATWVISSADEFTPEAEKEAEKSGVRLINGKEFAKMLLDRGLLDVNDAF